MNASDQRLTCPAIAAWIAAAVLVGMPRMAVWVAIGALMLTLALAAIAVRRGRKRSVPRHARDNKTRRRLAGWEGVVAVTFLAVSLVASVLTLRDASRSPPLLTSAVDSGRSVTVTLSVTDKTELQVGNQAHPWDRATDAGQPSEAEQRIRGTVIEITVGRARAAASVPVVVFAETGPNGVAVIGEIVSVTGQVELTEPGERAAALIFAREVTTVAEPPAWLAWAPQMRAGLVEKARELPGMGGELLPGLATGDTSAVSEELDASMKASSLSHLTAVSGANCAVIVAVIVMLLSALGSPRWLRIVGALVGLGLFVILVTPEPSVVRAALMAVAVLLALASGRPVAGLPVLSLVVLVLVVGDPWISRSYGFALSVLATAGLLTLTRPLTRALTIWMPRPIAAAIAIPLAAQLACQPVLILLDASLPLYGIPANLLAAPAAPAATLLGLLGCLSATAFPPLSWLALWLGWLPASWIAGIATTLSTLPGARLPWLEGGIGAVLLSAITAAAIAIPLARTRERRRIALVLSALLVVSGGAYAGTLVAGGIGPRLSLPKDWSYAACDVGQGDAVLIRSSGVVALIDTGPDPALLSDCLDVLGVSRVNLLVLTHFDLDHVGGVRAVTGRTDRVLTGVPENSIDERMLRDLSAAGAHVSEVAAGTRGRLGSTAWEVLWPPARTRSPPTGNDGSVVTVFDGNGIRSLFLGDLSERAQEAFLATRALRGTVDLVKVAHHGSADQSERLYRQVDARAGLISVGADNDYGHPAPSILDLLRGSGTTALRTDRCGMVVLGPSDSGLTVWAEHAAAGCP
ncbi:ComEC/Rec2 family competence protein [Mycetocola zhadangensis]|uniref:ComEC/Rec2 family competence protein n=1 Tax=Mycetocola zhadangensis TaxID=1164595 RepID=A0A3L7J656_9MICO|nr:ComEC/Rec2 family competence protein [Mycetocola zhadangensis]RLQ85990.1 ComEC/Rec2 family competence protein [Mycetocola zhadangensis]GGE87450.1 membrane protein [Mycetocola zhadangensis]